MPHILPILATVVDFGGSLIVLVCAALTLGNYLRKGNAPASVDMLRVQLAQGLVFALSFKTGAGLIRTISVATWPQLGSLLFIVALRFFLGRVLKRQTRQTARVSPSTR